MKAMLLAAGLGSRLLPLTRNLPKILVPVLEEPMLHRLLAFLKRSGVRSAAMNCHHLPAVLAMELARRPAPLPLRIFHETTLLGTGGGILNAREFWGDEHLVIWNGDILNQVPLGELCSFHQKGGALATLVLQDRPSDSRLILDGQDILCGIDSRRRGRTGMLRQPQLPTRSLAFNGISLLAPGLRTLMPAGGEFDLIDVLLDAVSAGALVRGYDVSGAFFGTTGSPEQLTRLEAALRETPQVAGWWEPIAREKHV